MIGPGDAAVLVLVADPAIRPLACADIAAAAQAVGASAHAARWLADDAAAEIPCAAPAPEGLAAARALGATEGFDVNLAPATGRLKRLLLADMDSTILAGETLDELAAKAGVGDAVAAITVRAMNGEIDFRAALAERVAMLAGRPVRLLEETLAEIALNPGAATLIATLRAHGCRTVLVSGGFDVFTAAVRTRLGFDRDVANRLETADGALTGRTLEPLVDRAAKLALLRAEAAALGIGLEATAAVGDGANDLDMIRAAGLGVAFRAKPVVASAAPFRIERGDLASLLYFMGIPRESFAAT